MKSQSELPSSLPKMISDDMGTWKTEDYEQVSTPAITYQNEPRYLINSSYFVQIMSTIEGKMLTVADATSDDLEKRKAVKSLIRNSIWESVKEIRLLRIKKV